VLAPAAAASSCRSRLAEAHEPVVDSEAQLAKQLNILDLLEFLIVVLFL
jgi:hypothetical protein